MYILTPATFSSLECDIASQLESIIASAAAEAAAATATASVTQHFDMPSR